MVIDLSVLFSIPCEASSVQISFNGTKLFIVFFSKYHQYFEKCQQLNRKKWIMFIASVNTDVNLTNSRRICEHIHKEALVICNIDKRDNPAELIDNYVEKN